MTAAARLTSLSFAALLAAAGCSSPDPHPPPGAPALAGTGISQTSTLSGLQAAGWTVCFQGAYNGTMGLATLLAGCSGKYMLLACRADSTTDALALAAADLRTVVTQVDGTGGTHTANGVGWYFNDSWSWGFYPAGQNVNLDTCDVDSGSIVLTQKDKRLCWHTDAGGLTAGYRCGTNENLDASATWQRLVMVHN